MKWFKTTGVYSMIFKVPALREEIGDPMEMYSVNRDSSLTQTLFIKCGKKLRLLLQGGRIVSWM